MGVVHTGVLIVLAVLLLLAGCGTSDDDGEADPPKFVFQVTSGGTSTTASTEGVTELPFSREVFIDLIFKEPISSAARSAIRVTTSPTFWRVTPRTSSDADTYSVEISSSTPALVVVTVQLDAESESVAFSLLIGAEDDDVGLRFGRQRFGH